MKRPNIVNFRESVNAGFQTVVLDWSGELRSKWPYTEWETNLGGYPGGCVKQVPFVKLTFLRGKGAFLVQKKAISHYVFTEVSPKYCI